MDNSAQAPAIYEFDNTADLGEQSIVPTLANVIAGLEDCTPLAHENRTARDKLSGETLDAEPLRVGIAPVA